MSPKDYVKRHRPLANAPMSAYDRSVAKRPKSGEKVPKVKGYLNVPEAATLLGVGETRIHALVLSGQLVPDLEIGRFKYFKRKALAAFSRTRREGPGMPEGTQTEKTKNYPPCPVCVGRSRKWTAYAGKQRFRCVVCKKVFYQGGDEKLPLLEVK